MALSGGRFYYNRGDQGVIGPRYTKYTPQGDTQDREDMILHWAPRTWCDMFEDFSGPIPTMVFEIPLFEDAAEANEFTVAAGDIARGSIMVPRAGILTGVQLTAEDALAANSDSNYLTFTLTNNGQNGSGTTAMLDATADANTTKLTGGTAITAETGRSIAVSATAANLRVAAGDLLTFAGTVSGTLDNEVHSPKVRLIFSTLPDTVTPRTTKTVGLLSVGPVSDSRHGEALCALGSTNEANVVGFDWGDQLLIPANARAVFQCRLKISGVAANTRMVWGLASAYNATFDSVADHAWFRWEGNSLNLLAETDDGTTDDDDNDTTFDLVADTYYLFTIDMTDTGLIRFSVDDTGYLELAGAAFANSDLLQPVVWLQKDSGTGEQTVTIDYVRASWDRSVDA